MQPTIICYIKNYQFSSHSPRLKVQQLSVDPLNVDISPEDVIIAIDGFDDVVVEAIEFLQQCQLLFNLQQLRMLGNGQAKQLLPAGEGDVFAVEVVKAVLIPKSRSEE